LTDVMSRKKGHHVEDCWEKGGGKEGEALKWWEPRKEMDLAKQTEETDFAFMTEEKVLISISASDWLADSDSTTHITRNRSDFTQYTEMNSQIEGITPGGSLPVKGSGTVDMEFKVSSKIYLVTLGNVKYDMHWRHRTIYWVLDS
jgi:hypothetical protein